MDKHNFMHSLILIQKPNSLLPTFNGCIVARKCFANIFHKLPADYEATSTAPTRAPLKENEAQSRVLLRCQIAFLQDLLVN